MTYKFSCNGKEHFVVAHDYFNAIDKACKYLESINDEVDLMGLDDWDDVVEECEYCNLKVSNIELEDE